MNRSRNEKNLFFSKTLDFLERYLPGQAMKSTNTIETYRDALTVFRKYITDTLHLSLRSFGFEDCTHDLLLDYLGFLNKSGNAAATCNNRLAAIRAYLWYAADGDISLQSVALTASHVPFLKVPKLTREIILEEDLSALLSAPKNTKTGKRDQMILILLYDSAIRVSELLSLDIKSVNLKAVIPYIRVYGKGDKERIVPITDVTAGHLKEYMKNYHPDRDADSPLIYTVIKGNRARMSVGNVERIIKKYAEQIRPDHPNLPESCYPHMVRRTRATNLYQDGTELELVSRILGHSSTETTRIYAVPSVEMMRKAMETGMLATDEEPDWPDDEAEAFPYFSPEEIRILLGTPKTEGKSGSRDVTLLALLYDSGARAQEVCDIIIGDMAFAKISTVRIHGKGNKTREIPISSDVVKLIKRYLAENGKTLKNNRNEHLFTSQRSDLITTACIRNLVRKYVALAKSSNPALFREKSYSPHSFRHSKSVHMLEAGVPLIYIRNFLGHESIQTTEVYLRIHQGSVSKILKERKIETSISDTIEQPPLKNRDIPEFLRNVR